MTDHSASDADSGATIQSVKTGIADRLIRSDPSVTVQTTDYFNNTFSPDLILTWPKTGRDRAVYLRTSNNPHYLLDDISYVRDEHPIMMPLGEISDKARSAREEILTTASRAERTLVAEPSSFDEFEDVSSDNSLTSLASRAFLQGGVGVIDASKTQKFSSDILTGFEGALSGVIDATAKAVDSAEEILDPRRFGELTSLLHAVWVGSGASGLDFPGESGINASLDAASLTLLLASAELSDMDFWQRVGRDVTVEVLRDVEITDDSENLQRLMMAIGGTLKAKATRIVLSASLGTTSPRWFARDGELGLQVKAHEIILAGKSIKEFSREGEESDVSISSLRSRAEKADIRLSEVEIRTGDRRLNYATADGTDVTEDSRLLEMEETMGTSSRVKSAVALVGTGQRELKSDFSTSTSHGNTASSFYVSEMIKNGVPLFLDLEPSEKVALLASIGEGDDSTDDTTPA